MKSKWNSCRLGDICSINANNYSESFNWDAAYYLDTSNITENNVESIQHFDLTIQKLPSRARRLVKIGSILYSMVRPVQKHYGYIKHEQNNFLVSTGFAVIDANAHVADSYYLYCYLRQPIIEGKLQAIAEQSVSTYPTLKPCDIANLEINLPPLPTQRKIAAILSALDDKIENNSAICKNLEEQAAALYKSWFVDFEPFGGVRPEKWAHRCLGEICVVGAGGDKPAEYSLQRTKEYSVPIFSNGLDNDGLFAYAKTARINEESVTVSARGTIGFVCLRHEPYFPIVRLLTIIPKKNLSSKYVYLTLKRMRIEGCGTTQQQLTVPDFSKTVILVPSNEVALAFTQIVTPLFEMMWNLQAENNALSSLRDTLLPKLMSGEIQPETISK